MLRFDPICGLKLWNWFVVVNRELFQVAWYAPPHGSVWFRPSAVLMLLFRMFVAPPASELVGCWVCEFFEMFEERLGAQKDRAAATLTSWICGSMRWIRMPRFCSSASLTASSIDRRRTVSFDCCAALSTAACSDPVNESCPVWPNADTERLRIANAIAGTRTRMGTPITSKLIRCC